MPRACVIIDPELKPILEEHFDIIHSSPWDDRRLIVQLEYEREGQFDVVLEDGKPRLKLDADLGYSDWTPDLG